MPPSPGRIRGPLSRTYLWRELRVCPASGVAAGNGINLMNYTLMNCFSTLTIQKEETKARCERSFCGKKDEEARFPAIAGPWLLVPTRGDLRSAKGKTELGNEQTSRGEEGG